MGLALITGASSGLGLEFARLFARDGHDTVLVARRRSKLDEEALQLRRTFPQTRVEVIDHDLGQPGSGRTLLAKMNKINSAAVDFLINNAGFGSRGLFAELPLEKELQMVDLNMRTLIELTHLCLPSMLARKAGRILNVGSTAGFQPGPFMSTYYASKAFVNSFSEALHEELIGTGVSCTVLAPGATATEFAKSANLESSRLFRNSGVASAPEVAELGYKALLSGQPLAIAGAQNRLIVQLLRLSPRSLVRKLAARLNQDSQT